MNAFYHVKSSGLRAFRHLRGKVREERDRNRDSETETKRQRDRKRNRQADGGFPAIWAPR